MKVAVATSFATVQQGSYVLHTLQQLQEEVKSGFDILFVTKEADGKFECRLICPSQQTIQLDERQLHGRFADNFLFASNIRLLAPGACAVFLIVDEDEASIIVLILMLLSAWSDDRVLSTTGDVAPPPAHEHLAMSLERYQGTIAALDRLHDHSTIADVQQAFFTVEQAYGELMSWLSDEQPITAPHVAAI